MEEALNIMIYIYRYGKASFFLKSRLLQYENIIDIAVKYGYSFITIEEFARRVRSGERLPELACILRKDVDTDPKTIRMMFEIDKKYGVRSSVYFRLSTLDYALMNELAECGCEVSYHFEEIADFAKRTGRATPGQVLAAMPDIQDIFRRNLTRLREKTGLPMAVVASHGDFANRLLGLPNHLLLTEMLRCELGLFAEVYDADLARTLSARISDAMPPVYWQGGDPLAAIRARLPVIYILIHPRHWRADVAVNLRDAARRLAEGEAFALRRRLAGSLPHGERTPLGRLTDAGGCSRGQRRNARP